MERCAGDGRGAGEHHGPRRGVPRQVVTVGKGRADVGEVARHERGQPGTHRPRRQAANPSPAEIRASRATSARAATRPPPRSAASPSHGPPAFPGAMISAAE